MSEITKLESMDSLDAAFAEPADHTVVLFKHSLTCGVSRRAFGEFEEFVRDFDGDDSTRFQMIEIQRQRELSREVAARTAVKHESPQVLVLRGGKVQWQDSHWRITRQALAGALRGTVQGA